MGPVTFFRLKQADFGNIRWFVSYTQKFKKKGKKLSQRETL